MLNKRIISIVIQSGTKFFLEKTCLPDINCQLSIDKILFISVFVESWLI